MEKNREERRINERFNVRKAVVSYTLKKGIFFKKTYDEKYPVIEMSRGGIRFQDRNPLKIDKKVFLKLYLPNLDDPLTLRGKVVWTSSSEDDDYKYQNGIQFFPFGPEQGFNQPEALDKIIKMEQETDNIITE
ncbi:MAG: PilZ domain-containing protein [Candidatus Aminicenantes bacterium]|nr:PilZ domain-containing protein [Candidatus Aminicenantes bacterium]